MDRQLNFSVRVNQDSDTNQAIAQLLFPGNCEPRLSEEALAGVLTLWFSEETAEVYHAQITGQPWQLVDAFGDLIGVVYLMQLLKEGTELINKFSRFSLLHFKHLIMDHDFMAEVYDRIVTRQGPTQLIFMRLSGYSLLNFRRFLIEFIEGQLSNKRLLSTLQSDHHSMTSRSRLRRELPTDSACYDANLSDRLRSLVGDTLMDAMMSFKYELDAAARTEHI